MPRLVLLNGPPGVGKSTIARLWVQRHPGALNLDIDRIRDLLGGWEQHPDESGRLARVLAVAMARAHLLGGGDVLVPQHVGRVEFVERLDDVARACGAMFIEIVLMTDLHEATRRFHRRWVEAAEPGHVSAGVMLERAGGPAELARMVDRLHEVLRARPGSRVVIAPAGQVEATYAEVACLLDAMHPPGAPEA